MHEFLQNPSLHARNVILSEGFFCPGWEPLGLTNLTSLIREHAKSVARPVHTAEDWNQRFRSRDLPFLEFMPKVVSQTELGHRSWPASGKATELGLSESGIRGQRSWPWASLLQFSMTPWVTQSLSLSCHLTAPGSGEMVPEVIYQPHLDGRFDGQNNPFHVFSVLAALQVPIILWGRLGSLG